MGLVFGLVFDAAIIGLVIVVMEKGEFPGWGPMIGVVIAIWVSSNAAALLLPDALSLLSLVVGAGVGALLINWACHLSLRRSAIAAGIYLGIRLAISFIMAGLLSA